MSNDTELTINELDLVSDGAGAPNASAVNTGGADVADPSVRCDPIRGTSGADLRNS